MSLHELDAKLTTISPNLFFKVDADHKINSIFYYSNSTGIRKVIGVSDAISELEYSIFFGGMVNVSFR